MIRLDRPHAVPLYNIYSQLVYALKGSDVRDVMVNGRVIVSDWRSLTLDAGVIIRKAREYRSRIKSHCIPPKVNIPLVSTGWAKSPSLESETKSPREFTIRLQHIIAGNRDVRGALIPALHRHGGVSRPEV